MDHPAKLFNQFKARTASQAKESRLLDPIPPEAGPRLTTYRGAAVHCVRPPASETFVANGHFVAVGLAPSPGVSAGYGSDKLKTFNVTIGVIDLNPAHVESRWVWPSTLEYMHIGFGPESLAELAEQELDKGRVDLQPVRFGTVDQKALYLAQMLKAELSEREVANELYVDSLITLFGIHLLRTYAGSGKAPRAEGGLPAQKAKRVRDYLQQNFSRKVSVADLAVLCELSPGHFIRAFSITFGQSPYQYLLHLRLGAAEQLLAASDLPITEVAYLSGFSSQSHLTTAMRRYKGATPAQIRASR
ncbi:helix-turn-helix domain-containing protein [Microvirga makkahensis]|uniref:Helix-turn-helix domain-containing protein n=1 Tax=Microvirga makkahensis TaxID=1128670 RepID=A0A7X3MWG0_9HYPH|nr:AraC family transcriptional regulator [Microvirga makkahensis]MXQ14476.1 helix-turn-helix domain-containing protein [Microvirga makkahensis]